VPIPKSATQECRAAKDLTEHETGGMVAASTIDVTTMIGGLTERAAVAPRMTRKTFIHGSPRIGSTQHLGWLFCLVLSLGVTALPLESVAEEPGKYPQPRFVLLQPAEIGPRLQQAPLPPETVPAPFPAEPLNPPPDNDSPPAPPRVDGFDAEMIPLPPGQDSWTAPPAPWPYENPPAQPKNDPAWLLPEPGHSMPWSGTTEVIGEPQQQMGQAHCGNASPAPSNGWFDRRNDAKHWSNRAPWNDRSSLVPVQVPADPLGLFEGWQMPTHINKPAEIPFGAVTLGHVHANDPTIPGIPEEPRPFEQPPLPIRHVKPAGPAPLAPEIGRLLWRPFIGYDSPNGVGYDDPFYTVGSFQAVFNEFNDAIFFTDLRLLIEDDGSLGGNAGFGLRKKVTSHGGVLGINFYYDYSETQFTSFSQAGIGAEYLGPNLDIRFNYYQPQGDTTNLITRSPLALVNTELEFYDFQQVALQGADFEFAVPLPFMVRGRPKAALGMYHFHGAETVPDVTGVKGRVDMQVTPNLYVGVTGRYDEVYDAGVAATAVWTFSGHRGWRRNADSACFRDRLADPVERLKRIVVVEETVRRVVQGPDGPVNVFFVDRLGGGDGSQANPTTVTAAQADPRYGARDILVGLDNTGTIADPVVLDALGQQVRGGGDNGALTLAFQEGSITFTGLGNRPVFGNTISLSSSSIIDGIALNGSPGDAIVGQGINGATINDVVITSPAASGIRFANTTGAISISNVTMTSTGGTGLLAQNHSGSLTAVNTRITDAGGNGILLDGVTGPVDLSQITVSGVGGNGIELARMGTSANLSSSVIANSTLSGLVLRNSVGSFNINGVIVDQSGQSGVAVLGNTGISTLTNMNVANSGTAGITVAGNAGVTNLQNVAVNGTGTFGLQIQQNAGQTNVTSATISNPGSIGVAVLANGSDTNFSGLIVRDSADDGIQLQANSGNVNFNNTTVERAGGDGIAVLGEQDGTASFNNTTIVASVDAGIRLQQTEGGVNFENTLISGAGTQGIVLDDTTGTYRFGETRIDNAGLTGFLIDDGDPNVTFTGIIRQTNGVSALVVRDIDGGSYSFTPGAAGGPVVFASNLTAGTFAVDIDADGALSQFTVNGLQVDAAGVGGGFRLQNLGTNGQGTFQNFAITNAATGIAVQNNQGFINFQTIQSASQGAGSIALLVQNNTSGLVNFAGGGNRLTNVGGRAALIENTDGFMTFDRINVTAGDADAVVIRQLEGGFFVNESFNIDGNTAGTAVLVEQSNGQFVFGNLDFENVLNGVAFNNTQGSLILSNGEIIGTGAAGTGVRIANIGGTFGWQAFNVGIEDFATGVELIVGGGDTLNLQGVNNSFSGNTQNSSVVNGGTINGQIEFNNGITVP
jgi:hypothetical protein